MNTLNKRKSIDGNIASQKYIIPSVKKEELKQLIKKKNQSMQFFSHREESMKSIDRSNNEMRTSVQKPAVKVIRNVQSTLVTGHKKKIIDLKEIKKAVSINSNKQSPASKETLRLKPALKPAINIIKSVKSPSIMRQIDSDRNNLNEVINKDVQKDGFHHKMRSLNQNRYNHLIESGPRQNIFDLESGENSTIKIELPTKDNNNTIDTNYYDFMNTCNSPKTEFTLRDYNTRETNVNRSKCLSQNTQAEIVIQDKKEEFVKNRYKNLLDSYFNIVI